MVTNIRTLDVRMTAVDNTLAARETYLSVMFSPSVSGTTKLPFEDIENWNEELAIANQTASPQFSLLMTSEFSSLLTTRSTVVPDDK